MLYSLVLRYSSQAEVQEAVSTVNSVSERINVLERKLEVCQMYSHSDPSRLYSVLYSVCVALCI